MHRTTLVPYHQLPGQLMVVILEVRIDRMIEEVGENFITLAGVHTDDLRRVERIHIEPLTTGHRVNSHHRLDNLWQGRFLLRCQRYMTTAGRTLTPQMPFMSSGKVSYARYISAKTVPPPLLGTSNA